MTIITSPKELLEESVWHKYCLLTGTDPWLADADDEAQIVLTKCEAQKLGLIPYDTSR
jgi:hypothetical protein